MEYSTQIKVGRFVGDAFKFYDRGKIRQWARLTGQVLSQDEHAERCEKAIVSARVGYANYFTHLNVLSIETFGKPWHWSMYRISTIGSDEFSETGKDTLRMLVHDAQMCKDVARIHLAFLIGKPKKRLAAMLDDVGGHAPSF